jgi:hypothetical protein
MERSQLVEDNIDIREKNDGNFKDGILIESTDDVFEQGDTWPAKLQRLARKFKIEQRGIERVPENGRTDINGVINVGTMVRGTYFIFYFPSIERHDDILCSVACCEYGGQLVRNRSTGYACLLPGFCGQHLGYSLLQHTRHSPSRIFLYIWTRVRSTADGAFEVLFWLLWCQDQCVVQF